MFHQRELPSVFRRAINLLSIPFTNTKMTINNDLAHLWMAVNSITLFALFTLVEGSIQCTIGIRTGYLLWDHCNHCLKPPIMIFAYRFGWQWLELYYLTPVPGWMIHQIFHHYSGNPVSRHSIQVVKSLKQSLYYRFGLQIKRLHRLLRFQDWKDFHLRVPSAFSGQWPFLPFCL